MNITISDVQAKRAAKIALCNGISVAKYVNMLVESALNAEIKHAKAQALDGKRRKVIDRAWETHTFPKGISIEDFEGWESSGGDVCMDFNRKFCYSSIAEPARVGTVHAYFDGRSVKPRYITFRDSSGCDL
jgi:hypothetical protein